MEKFTTCGEAMVASAVSAKTKPTVDQVADRLSMVTDRLRSLNGNLSEHADKLSGPIPETDSIGVGRPCQSGLLGYVDELENCLRMVEDTFSRL